MFHPARDSLFGHVLGYDRTTSTLSSSIRTGPDRPRHGTRTNDEDRHAACPGYHEHEYDRRIRAGPRPRIIGTCQGTTPRGLTTRMGCICFRTTKRAEYACNRSCFMMSGTWPASDISCRTDNPVHSLPVIQTPWTGCKCMDHTYQPAGFRIGRDGPEPRTTILSGIVPREIMMNICSTFLQYS